MKIKDLLLVGLTYWACVTVAYFVTRTLVDDAAGCSQAGGTIAAVIFAIWLYQSENQQSASAKVKLAVGASIAVFSLVQALAFQSMLKWMDYPDIAISMAIAGAFIFPFVFWNTFSKSFRGSQKQSTR